jgi:hypothetical protein
LQKCRIADEQRKASEDQLKKSLMDHIASQFAQHDAKMKENETRHQTYVEESEARWQEAEAQNALIACRGGQAGRVKNAFIPVFIDDITIWPQKSCEEWGSGTAVGHLKGLRGAHASVQLVDQTGAPRLVINQLRCVAHYDGRAQNPDDLETPSPYT